MQPAPYRAPIVNPAGVVSPEWTRWFQQLQTSGGTVETISANAAALEAQITAANTAVASLAAQVAALPPALALSTNNRPNGSQSKLNLRQGKNVTLSDDGAGNLTIAAADPPPPQAPAAAAAIPMLTVQADGITLAQIVQAGNLVARVDGTTLSPAVSTIQIDTSTYAAFS